MQIPVDIPIIIVPLFGITALWFMSTWGVAFAGLGALRTGKICHHCRSKIHLKAKICPSCDLPQADKDLTTELRPHPEGLVSAGVRTARSERRGPPSATRQKKPRVKPTVSPNPAVSMKCWRKPLTGKHSLRCPARVTPAN